MERVWKLLKDPSLEQEFIGQWHQFIFPTPMVRIVKLKIDECIGDAKCMSGASDASAKGMESRRGWIRARAESVFGYKGMAMGGKRLCTSGVVRVRAQESGVPRPTMVGPHRPQSTVSGLTRGEGRTVSSKQAISQLLTPYSQGVPPIS